jgi:hypothetical protein
MSTVKAIGLAALFGLLSVAVTTAGIIIGAILAVLTPVAIVFTGLWFAWFITKDFDEEKPD